MRYQIVYMKRGFPLTTWADDADRAQRLAAQLRRAGYASRNASLSSMTSIIFIMRSRFNFGVLFSSSTMCSGFSVTSASPPLSVALVLPISSHRGTIATERRCKNEPVVN